MSKEFRKFYIGKNEGVLFEENELVIKKTSLDILRNMSRSLRKLTKTLKIR